MFVVAWRRAARAAAVVGLVAGALVTLAVPGHADEQRVKRFGVALYVMPTGLALDDFNQSVDGLNQFTAQQGLAPIDQIHWAAQFGLEGRFQATHHWMLVAGFGQIKKRSELNLIPQVGQSIVITASILSVPENLGAAYYFNPKTSGDFTMRPFVGAGMIRLVETKAKLGGQAVLADTTFGTFSRPQGEGGGYYAEAGVHMMFPSRYSIILNGIYRHAKTSRVYEETTGQLLYNADGSPYELDVSGVGLRFAFQINLFGKPLH